MLFISHHGDFHVDVIAEVLRRDYSCIVDVLSEKPSRILGNFSIEVGVERTDLSQPSWNKVWYRRYPNYSSIAKKFRAKDRGFAIAQYESLLQAFTNTIDARNYVDTPYNIYLASDKIRQLQIAREIGIKIPETLFSSSKESIVDFCERLSWNIIVKPIKLSSGKRISTRVLSVDDKNFILEESMSDGILPAIYQNNIAGESHIRLNIFGKKSSTFLLKSQEVDWRFSIDKIKIERIENDNELIKLCNKLMKKLSITMGVIDFKLNKGGEPIFFEINPQGQFLFLEPFNDGVSLIKDCCEFLAEENRGV